MNSRQVLNPDIHQDKLVSVSHPELAVSTETKDQSKCMIRFTGKMKKGYVYILTNKSNSVLYIGVTANLSQRITSHKQRNVPGFTKTYNCTKLIYLEIFDRIEEAIFREKQLKNWHRDWKLNLIRSVNPTFEEVTVNT